ncbi:hypothetical protein SEEH0318_08084, partial [Salmonella enterica subsp. enterica serovar Heidelberg str. 90-0318]
MNEGWYQVRIAGSDMAPDTRYCQTERIVTAGGQWFSIVPR